MKRIVVIGAGFAGIRAAQEFSGQGVDALIIDRNNYHLFQPLLYQVASAGLEQEAIAYPVRAMTRNWSNIRFKRGAVSSLDAPQKMITTEGGENIPFDFLIVASGSMTNFFGNENVAKFSFDLKKLVDAEKLRNRILNSFENAVNETDPKVRKKLMTFVVVGGGPTGVEFAGALAELVNFVMAKDYPELRVDQASIILVEAAERLLLPFPEKLSGYARKRLLSMGVECRFGTRVVDASKDSVTFHDGTTIEMSVLFWSAGVKASPLAENFGFELASGGRVPVNPDLTVKGFPDIYAVGDTAYFEQNDKPVPMVAPVAMQMGRYAAKHILGRIWERPVSNFHYIDKGSMATIGKSSAVAFMRGLSLKGAPAWIAWLLLHLFYLAGFRNRVVVMLNWMWYYWFHERQVRMITEDK